MVEYDRLPSGPFGSVPTHQILSMAYEIAICLDRDPAVRRFLQRRQSALSA
jgi:hypothetical protein